MKIQGTFSNTARDVFFNIMQINSDFKVVMDVGKPILSYCRGKKTLEESKQISRSQYTPEEGRQKINISAFTA